MKAFFNRASIAASSAFSTMGRHKMISVALILQCFFSIYLISVILQQNAFSQAAQAEQAGETETFSLIQNLDGSLYYGYFGDHDNDNQTYKSLIEFYDKINSCEELTYYIVNSTVIDICNDEIPVSLLLYHEMFEDDEDLINQSHFYDDDGVLNSSVDCMLVSRNCFSDNDIYSGRLWTEEDLEWSTGEEVPVILGYSFTEVYKVGDVFEAKYSLEPITCRVIGFLKPSVNIYAVIGKDYCEECDETLLLPALNVNEEGIDRFGKAVVLDRIGGYVESNTGFEKTNTLINTMLGESGIVTGGSGIYLQSNGIPDINANIYSYMTEDVRQQFYLLLCFLVIFVIFSITFTLNGFLRENYYSYGIMLLCGGNSFDISLSIVIICLVIVGTAYFSMMFILILSECSFVICAAVTLVSVAIIAITCISPVRHISKYDISHIIGGKE